MFIEIDLRTRPIKTKSTPQLLSVLLVSCFCMLYGCKSETNESSFLIRLVDPDRIASFKSDHTALLKNNPNFFSNNHLLIGQDTKTDNWRPFLPHIELGGQPLTEKFKNKKPGFKKHAGGIKISGQSGICRILPVESNKRILMACKGKFSGKVTEKILICELSGVPSLDKKYKPNQLKNLIKKYEISRYLLKHQTAKNVKSITLKLKKRTKSILIMACVFEKSPLIIEWLGMGIFGERVQFYSERTKRDIIHPVIALNPFIESTVKPSILLPPNTSVTFKPINMKKGMRFECSLGVLGELTNEVSVEMTAYNKSGKGEQIFEETIDPGLDKWIDIKSNLFSLADQQQTLIISCKWKDKNIDKSITPPLVCCGSPILYGKQLSDNKPGFNLILISLDTLRSDHLGCYGYHRPVSPNIDKISENSIVFKNAYAHASYTLPTHVSMFSSVYPGVHGVQNRGVKIPNSLDLLSEIAARNGLATASYNNGGLVSHEFGFHRGFDLYCEVDPIGDWTMDGEPYNPLSNRFSNGDHGSLDRVMDWLEAMKNQQFYLFLHTFMVHEFVPPKDIADEFNKGCKIEPSEKERRKFNLQYLKDTGLTQEEVTYFRNMYDATIKVADEMVGDIFKKLESLNLHNNTVVVLTSDHGEEFYEHGQFRHGKSLYKEVVHVPLIFYVPGYNGKIEVEDTVQQIDILPTVLDLLNIESQDTMQGVSLLPLMQGKGLKKRMVVMEMEKHNQISQRSIIANDWKYIEGDTSEKLAFPARFPKELYNLKSDPNEKQNIYEAYPDILDNYSRQMKNTLNAFQKLNQKLGLKQKDKSMISEKLRETLKQQGYF